MEIIGKPTYYGSYKDEEHRYIFGENTGIDEKGNRNGKGGSSR
jgi:hypothetical protein